MSIISLLLFVAGFVLLLLGAEVLVRGASRLAIVGGISPLVVGLTVVAYGTSAPELAVTVFSTYQGQADIAVGNVVGSNISNVLLVLGISAVAAPLVVSRQLVRSSVPFMIIVSMVFYVLGWNGYINRWEGLLLLGGALFYTVYSILRSRAETRASREEFERELPAARTSPRELLLQLAYVIIGLVMLVGGSKLLVDRAVELAEFLGISKLVVGLTVVAIGTSLPEIATSVIAVLRGQRDIAVGNVVGSNIFNILLVMGMSGLVAQSPGVVVSPAALQFNLPIMLAVSFACLPIFYTGFRISRWEGALFLAYYAAYLLFLFLRATDHEHLGLFSVTMLGFVLPLTLITIVVLCVRAVRREMS